MDIYDRITGMIYGAVYGDVLGAPHERHRSELQLSDIILKPIRHFNRFENNWSESVIGQFTDDTEMSMTLLKYLVHNKWNYHPSKVVNEYMKWANSGTKFLGRNTRELLKGVKTLRGYQSRYQKKFNTQTDREQSLSNGALMRSYPIAIYSLMHSDFQSVIEADCQLTNPSTIAINTEKQYIESINKALHNDSKESILGDFDIHKRPDITINKGLCTHALYCSYYGLMNYDNYIDAIKGIIMLGGDTDTNASIAGALLGAFYGIKNMSNDMEFSHNLEIIKNRDVSKGDYPRPIDYSPQVIDELLNAIQRTIIN